ncbi:unnamed protein product [Diatraea saccharalis]|uniref:Uncharacterized protein n=1 Tax=Diatraea saccharalis TaxID=40085 RepID=A0A9N9RBP7_9NEOP|nr:unnamed protein product [Diatraea saccharalis]
MFMASVLQQLLKLHSVNKKGTFDKINMRAIFALFLIAMVLYLIHSTEANYRKPPFNGSIFGKRGTVGKEINKPKYNKFNFYCCRIIILQL